MPAFDFVLAGRYRLVAPLGEGGMAAVYKGRDLRLNRDVAVKILRDELTRDPDFLDRFEREAQMVAQLSHPHIVPVYDVGDESGTHFIVMEYVRGRTLRDAIDVEGRLAPERAAAILRPILEALAYAHERGLVHRDVKPQNILLMPDGSPRLADFGIARLTDGSTTRTAAILGSAHYLAPEQARGEEADARSDIYACGVVLYEMLAGSPPFDGPNALAIANLHLTADPPPLGHAVPPPLQQAVTRALAKDPVDRFEDALDFAAALAAVPASDATAVFPLDALHRDLPQPLEHSATQLAALVPPLAVRRSARKSVAAGSLVALIVAAIAYVASLPAAAYRPPSYPSAPYLAVPVSLMVAMTLAWLRIRSWRYTMDGATAVVQWGLVGHQRFGIPLSRIVTLRLKQSPIDRLLRVGTVELAGRDAHGDERVLVLEDVPRPRETYEEIMRLVARSVPRRADS